MKWSNSIRKWSRLIHRDLSFFFAGMVLIYAISGIVMNHRDTINPNFSIERKEYKIAEKLPGKEGMKRENVLTLLQPLGALSVTPTAAPTPEPELTLSAARHTARRRSSAFWAACPKGPAGAPADCMRIYTCIA